MSAKVGKDARKALPSVIRLAVLAESGFRCANPNCGNTIAIDLHHLVYVSVGGADEAGNLIALCPYCHSLHHRGEIATAALVIWKSVLQQKSSPIDVNCFEMLLMLQKLGGTLKLSTDAVMYFRSPIVHDYVSVRMNVSLSSIERPNTSATPRGIEVTITEKGRRALTNWLRGKNPDLGGGAPES